MGIPHMRTSAGTRFAVYSADSPPRAHVRHLAQHFILAISRKTPDGAIAAAEPDVLPVNVTVAGSSHHGYHPSRHQAIFHDREDFLLIRMNYLRHRPPPA
jgi:hypothetical protein